MGLSLPDLRAAVASGLMLIHATGREALDADGDGELAHSLTRNDQRKD